MKKKTIKNIPRSVAWPLHAVRDWRIIVLVFAVGLISLSFFAWRIYLSNKIAGGYLSPGIEVSDMNVKTIDKKRLETDLLILETRQADYLKLKSTQIKLLDPSL